MGVGASDVPPLPEEVAMAASDWTLGEALCSGEAATLRCLEVMKGIGRPFVWPGGGIAVRPVDGTGVEDDLIVGRKRHVPSPELRGWWQRDLG